MSGRTPVPGSALYRHPHRATTDHARLPLSGLPSGQTQVQGLPQTPLPEQPAPTQSSSPAAVSALGRLPVHLFAYLHVPVSAAPATLEWKHPVDAHQQLCPQISRRVSCPRGAKICAHCLWPGCLAPRPRLPASICRHQRPPRRVRRQHAKVAVPMLARRWYQCRNPIQKLTCAQPQFNSSLLLLLLLRPVPLQRRPRQPVAHLRPASCPYQPLTGKHRTRKISQQPLAPSTILRCDRHARMHRKTAAVPPPLHCRNRLPAQ